MNNKVIILIFGLIAIASAGFGFRVDTQNTLWGTWKLAHNKQYSAAEDAHRLEIFLQNTERIARLNAENNGVKFAVNKFADLTEAEFKAKYVKGGLYQPETHSKEFRNYANVGNLPDSVDWRNKGAVTPVRDQGECGSCYTFSAVGALESLYYINSGKLVQFSEQQVLNCAVNAGTGCNGGGWPYLALYYAAHDGMETEDDYPYTGKDENCKYDDKKAVHITTGDGYMFVTPKSTDQLKAALVENPVSVLVEADEKVFQFYSSGVISTGCGAIINHAVLAVGYQKVGALEAFIVRNSWGTSWGSDGYVYISTIQQLNNGKGACGILYQPVVPTL